MPLGAWGGQKRESGLLELLLQAVVCELPMVGAGNGIWVLYRGRKFF